jgi:glycosyltransferase involved in cell wall biosynthesis
VTLAVIASSPRGAATPEAEELLPRLAYIGDVPVEADMHGSALLYRLFEGYPKNKLLIVEGSRVSQPTLRIPVVEYRKYYPIFYRHLPGRFHPYTSPVRTFTASFEQRSISRLVRDFRPEAVVTVAWGYVWATAAAYAEHHRLPLHLIVHDDWPQVDVHGKFEKAQRQKQLKRWYPMAASRLCVSPFMAEEYERRYGAEGDVLYPSRSRDGLSFNTPSELLQGNCKPFTVAFAGSIYWEYARALQRLALALRRRSGRVIVYGRGVSKDDCPFLCEPNIEMRGKADARELIQQCRDEAHAIYVPMSYRPEDRMIVETGFPSKLTDATAIGIPLIIDGPEYCSAVIWAQANPKVAEIITDASIDSLTQAIERLQIPAHRIQLATEAIRLGAEYFDWKTAVRIFLKTLRQTPELSRRAAQGRSC